MRRWIHTAVAVALLMAGLTAVACSVSGDANPFDTAGEEGGTDGATHETGAQPTTSAAEPTGDPDSSTSSNAGDDDGGGGPLLDVGGDDGGGVVVDCDDEIAGAGDIYVIDEAQLGLHRFHPPDKQFELVGVPDCGPTLSPFSMAIDRSGVAKILYQEGGVGGPCAGVYGVDISDASCLGQTDFVCGTEGFSRFGMGYSTDGPGSLFETLYIGAETGVIGNNPPPAPFASMDPVGGDVSVIGTVEGSGHEFTGNALGELWAFSALSNPMTVLQVDKTDGHSLVTYDLSDLFPPMTFTSPRAWAWSFWGGDFYIFLQLSDEDETVVHRVFGPNGSGPEGELEVYMPTTNGLSIVGAGVATCAPVTPEG